MFGIVKQSGGHIWLYSEPGRGTTFKIYFPRCFEAPEDDDMMAPREAPERGTDTILLFEDEPGVRAFAKRAVQRAGNVVLAAENGGEALLIVEQHAGVIDLLLTDVVMPRMGGSDLATELCRLRPELRVLYMSGHQDSYSALGLLDAAEWFLSKPFSATELLTKIRQVLARPPRRPAPHTMFGWKYYLVWFAG